MDGAGQDGFADNRHCNAMISEALENARVFAERKTWPPVSFLGISKLGSSFEQVENGMVDTSCIISDLSAEVEMWTVKLHNLMLETIVEFN